MVAAWHRFARSPPSSQYVCKRFVPGSTGHALDLGQPGAPNVTAGIGGTVSIVDVSRHRVVKTIALRGAAKPVGVAVSPDGQRVYVANGHGHSVTVLDRRVQIVRTIAVGTRPWNLALTADGSKLYTANGESNDVSVVDTRTGKVIRRIAAGPGPWGVAISDSSAAPSGRRTRQTR